MQLPEIEPPHRRPAGRAVAARGAVAETAEFRSIAVNSLSHSGHTHIPLLTMLVMAL